MYEEHAKVIEQADAIAGHDLVGKVELLLQAVRSWSGSGTLEPWSVIGSKLNLANLDAWILQAKKDPSFSQEVVKGWADTLEAHIRNSLKRFECAKLFGNLFNEWISSGDSVTAVNSEADVSMPFVEVGRKELHEQKERLNSIIFDMAPTDSEALTSYLTDLFSSEHAAMSLNTLRFNIQQFAAALECTTITADDMRWTIDALLASGLMDETKRLTLREFQENPTALDEVASVLNMRLASLGSWSWPTSGVTIEMRRHLNGKYRAFTDPEILDGLFLQYLGCQWQVKFKEVFRDFFKSKAWTPSIEPPSKSALDRRTYFLKESVMPASIEECRGKLREGHFLVSQLRTDVHSTPSYDEPSSRPLNSASATSTKQTLLHLMTTDCLLDKALHGCHTIVRTDFEWFGPSLPHSSILILLAFWGVPQNWLNFFEAFLAAPLRFKDEPAAPLRVRRRGTAISYALSALCGEAILFAMDFAVNQRAEGLFLYRIHDDLWFWDAKPEKCVKAWQEMKRFAALVGLTFNNGKTGSACVEGNPHAELPGGDIRWGFLKFQRDEARLVIDQQDVDTHIVELRRQLAATKSVFGWVNAYNKYMAFFVRSFGGQPSNSFGLAHLNDVIETLARIQRGLFPGAEGGAVGHLRGVIEARFGVRDLPEGYFWLPVGCGGLELRNPVIEPLAMMEAIHPDPERVFVCEIGAELARYNTLRERFVREYSPAGVPGFPLVPPMPPAFMSYEEYSAPREARSLEWAGHYAVMMQTPPVACVGVPPTLQGGGMWKRGAGPYEAWVAALYGDELMKKFGTLEVVDPSLIPVGLVQLFRSSRLRWDQ